jgi:hypothetical protein
MQDIIAHVDSHPEEIILTRDLLKNGLMCAASRVAKDGELAEGVSRIRHLPMKFLREFLSSAEPTLTEVVLSKMSKVDGKIRQKLFCMGTRADPQDPVFTKDKKKFKQYYTEVYKAMGKRLGHITHHEGVVDWSASGVFKLCKEGAGDTFTHLQHLSGEKLKLPSTLSI